jgi:hypothetical protein
VTWSVATAVTVAAALAPGEPDTATEGVATVPADGEAALVGTGVPPHGSAVAEGPEGTDTATDAVAPVPADGEAAPAGESWGAGEDVEDAPPHPSTRIATAIAAWSKPRKVALERRLIDSPIG